MRPPRSIALLSLALLPFALAPTTPLAAPAAVSPDSLGTLLLSPSERNSLMTSGQPPATADIQTPSPPAIPPDRVTRQRGPGTLWHEGIAYRLPPQATPRKLPHPQQLSAWPQTSTLTPGAIRIVTPALLP